MWEFAAGVDRSATPRASGRSEGIVAMGDVAGAGENTETETKTVCVTGAGGFVASWLVQRLLAGAATAAGGGYTVHGTVRDPSDPKNAHLKALDGAGERLRLFKADVLDYASVAAAVAGCDCVFHVASPVPVDKPQNPDVEVLTPAVRGTQNVLRACRDAKVRRVVVVSSAAAVIVKPNVPSGAVLDEDSWSHEDYCRNTGMWYYLSKTLAEREALAYAEKTGLDVVTVCPPLVLGPLLQPVVNTSSLIFVNLLKKGELDAAAGDKARNVVDVRDLAEALVLAYESAEASGRYICSGYWKQTSEMVAIVRSFYPDLGRFAEVEGEKVEQIHGRVVKGCCRFAEVAGEKMVSSKKVQRMGLKFRPQEETLKDSVESYVAAGIL